MAVDRLDFLGHAEHVWAIEFSNGWQYTPSRQAADDAKRQGLNVVGYVPAFIHQGAVEDQRAMAQVRNAVESLRAGSISTMSAWQAVVDAVDRTAGGQSETPAASDEICNDGGER